MKFIVPFAASLLLCGCAPFVWVRPNTTPEPTQQDGNQTIRDADADYCLRAKGYTYQRSK